MAYKDLTKAEQDLLASEDKKIRNILRQFMQLVRDVDFLVWEQWSEQTISPLLGKLGGEELLPNTTTLAGARDMTVADVDAVRSIAKQLYSIGADNLPLIVKAIGINAQ